LRNAKLFLALGLALLTASVPLSGCGTGRQAQAPASKQELVIGIGRDFYTGPATSTYVHISTGVWEPLTYPDANLEPVMRLAEKMTPDATRKVWTVDLRKGVKFHDGTPLNAEAVIASVMRLKNQVKLDDYATFVDMEKVEAAGESSVKFTFTRPMPAFPSMVAYAGCPIFSVGSFNDKGEIAFPYGTGPFKFAEYKKGEYLTLVRNDDYWDGQPKLTRVTFKPILDASTRLAALKTGEIQAIADVGGVLPEQAAAVREDGNLVLGSQEVTTTHYLVFNNRRAPFNDKSLRQMVSLSIDRQQLVDKLLAGYGTPGDTLFTNLAKGWVVTGLWKTDEAKAAQLASQAAAGERVKAVFVINSALANRWPYKAIAEVVQSNLQGLGIDVEIRSLEAAAWSETLKKGDFDLTLSPYTLTLGDPDFFCKNWVNSKGAMNVQRGVGYSNPQADQLVSAAALETDQVKRHQLYSDLQRLVAGDCPIAPIYNDVSIYAARKEVEDLSLDPFFKPSLDKAWIAGES
jgi:peptide/nickel transport system substrate-binding protein